MAGLIQTKVNQDDPLESLKGYEAEQVEIDPATDTVQGQAESIIAKDSPLMQQAATRGKQYAASRGLLNSSMGSQATQAAVMDRAIPIASQDASTYFNSKLANQGATNRAFEFTAGVGNQAAMQERANQLQRGLMTHGATLEEGLMNVADRIQRGQMRLSTNLQKEILSLSEALKRGTMTHGADLQERLDRINAALQQETMTHGEILARGTMRLGSELRIRESEIGAELEKAIMTHGSDLEKQVMTHGTELQKDVLVLAESLKRDTMTHGADIEKDILSLAEELKQGTLRLSNELQQEILTLAEELERGTMEVGADLEERLMNVSEGLKRDTMELGAELETGLIQERSRAAIAEGWARVAQETQLLDTQHAQTLERIGAEQADLIERMNLEQRFGMEDAVMAGSQRIQELLIAEIGAINRTQGLTVEQQRQAIDQVVAQAEGQMDYMTALASDSPTWDPVWESFPSISSPPAGTDESGAQTLRAPVTSQDFSSYVQAYPDLLEVYNRGNHNMSMSDWGRWHWSTYGINENRGITGG